MNILFGKSKLQKKADHLDNVRVMVIAQIDYQEQLFAMSDEAYDAGIVLGLRLALRFLNMYSG